MTTSFTRDRGYSRARRMGKDEEEGRQVLQELVDDPDAGFGDILAAVIEAASPQQMQEVSEAIRELGEDRRGPRAFARDRLERRRLSRDIDIRRSRDRRLGRDVEWGPYADEPDRPIEEFHPEESGRREEAADRRRRMGSDAMALDSRHPRSSFRAFYPQASRIERA